MAQFIYLFDERDLSRIKKSRIKKSKWNAFDGVYLFPQTENFEVNHQWMRELKRRNRLNMLEARIRIPDDTPVLIGKYNGEHIEISAAKVVSITREHEDPLGLEVIAPQKIEPKEIISFYKPPKVTGWRYYPTAKGVKPCGCEYCQRGEPYSKKIRLEYDNT
jgi:hypothetical protein